MLLYEKVLDDLLIKKDKFNLDKLKEDIDDWNAIDFAK